MGYQYTMLSQIMNLITRFGFERIVRAHKGDKWVKKFDTKSHFTVMMYGQITGKDSLRDIVNGLKMHESKLYHLGLKGFSKSSLSDANRKRDWEIWREIFYEIKGRMEGRGKHGFKFKGKLYLLDSTIIELSIGLFEWASYRRRKGGIKLHTLLEVDRMIPEVVVVGEARGHDVSYAREVVEGIIQDSIIVFDRGYIDYGWFRELDEKGIYFVTRARRGMDYVVSGQLDEEMSERMREKGVIEDKEIKLMGESGMRNYPKRLRMVVYEDKESGKEFRFITNNFKLSPLTIAKLYKKRWDCPHHSCIRWGGDIEIFFKWIKQNLKIKPFLETTKNAVLTQIWIALIYYLLLSYIRYKASVKKAEIIVILSKSNPGGIVYECGYRGYPEER